MKKFFLLFCISFCGMSVFAQGQRPDALILYRDGKFAESIAVCEDELRETPDRIESYIVMCWSLVGNKQYSQAEIRATEALKLAPSDIRVIEVLGEAKYYLGKNNGAMEQFQKYVANAKPSAPRLGSAFYFMGEIYIKQGRYQHADISFTSACRQDPTIDRWWVRLGYARKMAGNYRESYTAYEEALRLNPASQEAKAGMEEVGKKF
ncbi:MAG: tetratricopeptide repeat protein [Treponema sp.]|nr:tetratricopeptide repeat protein [Treponema sp.]